MASSPSSDQHRIPECAEKSLLMDAYSGTIAELADVLNSRMGTMYHGDYERLYKQMSVARLASESAHQDLLNHIRQHGC